jgi:hypothetical protein
MSRPGFAEAGFVVERDVAVRDRRRSIATIATIARSASAARARSLACSASPETVPDPNRFAVNAAATPVASGWHRRCLVRLDGLAHDGDIDDASRTALVRPE